jgi:hypothetical protein
MHYARKNNLALSRGSFDFNKSLYTCSIFVALLPIYMGAER